MSCYKTQITFLNSSAANLLVVGKFYWPYNNIWWKDDSEQRSTARVQKNEKCTLQQCLLMVRWWWKYNVLIKTRTISTIWSSSRLAARLYSTPLRSDRKCLRNSCHCFIIVSEQREEMKHGVSLQTEWEKRMNNANDDDATNHHLQFHFLLWIVTIMAAQSEWHRIISSSIRQYWLRPNIECVNHK